MQFSEACLTPALYLVLSTAMELLNADKGNVQFYDEGGGYLPSLLMSASAMTSSIASSRSLPDTRLAVKP